MHLLYTFKLACAAAGITQADFARRHNMKRSTLHQVLTGKMTSRRISALVVKFMDTELSKLADRLQALPTEKSK